MPALVGVTLYTAWAVIGAAERFTARKNTWFCAPGCTSIWLFNGRNSQSRPGAIWDSNRTVISPEAIWVGALSARCVAPPKPVAAQNRRYNGTDAKDMPTIPMTTEAS